MGKQRFSMPFRHITPLEAMLMTAETAENEARHENCRICVRPGGVGSACRTAWTPTNANLYASRLKNFDGNIEIDYSSLPDIKGNGVYGSPADELFDYTVAAGQISFDHQERLNPGPAFFNDHLTAIDVGDMPALSWDFADDTYPDCRMENVVTYGPVALPWTVGDRTLFTIPPPITDQVVLAPIDLSENGDHYGSQVEISFLETALVEVGFGFNSGQHGASATATDFSAVTEQWFAIITLSGGLLGQPRRMDFSIGPPPPALQLQAYELRQADGNSSATRLETFYRNGVPPITETLGGGAVEMTLGELIDEGGGVYTRLNSTQSGVLINVGDLMTGPDFGDITWEFA